MSKLSMLSLLLPLFIFILPAFTNSNPPEVFPDERFAQHNAVSFFKLAEANRVIDLLNPDPSLMGASLFYATNEFRLIHHLKPFAFSPVLKKTAAYYCSEMVAQKFFSHTHPRSKPMSQAHLRITHFGGTYNIMAENIAYTNLKDITDNKKYYAEKEKGQGRYVHYFSSGKVIPTHTYASFGRYLAGELMKSPGHRRNILNKKLTELGCASLALPGLLNSSKLPMAKSVQNFGGY